MYVIAGSHQVIWVCVSVVVISCLRDEHSVNTESLFMDSGQIVVDEGVVWAVVRIGAFADMVKKGLSG